MRRGRGTVRLLGLGIGAAWWLTWALLAAVLVLPAVQWATGAPVSSPFLDVSVVAEPRSDAAAVAVPGWGEAQVYGVEAELEFSRAPAWFLLGSVAGWVSVFGVMLFFLHHLRQLAGRIEAGAAFEPANVRRLRLLGGALAAGEVLEGAVMWWQSHAVAGVAESAWFEFGRVYEVDPGVLFAALTLFVLAEIFRRGTLLEEDQALTV